jgi:hypothetical protein
LSSFVHALRETEAMHGRQVHERLLAVFRSEILQCD